jgi:hypothetical protein
MVITDVQGVVDDFPVTVVSNMVDSDDTTRGSISVGSTGDSTDTEVNGFLDFHIVLIVSVENTISEGTTGTDREEVTRETGGVIIDVIEVSTSLIRSSEHSSHGESTSSVLSHDRAQDHRGHRHGALLSVTELVNSAEHSDVFLPEETIGGTTSHGSDEELIDLNNLAHFVRGDERSLSSTSIDSNHDSVLELKGQSGGTLVVLGNFRS